MILVEREVVHKLARALSGLLDRRQLASWNDISDATLRKTTSEKLLNVVEDMSNIVAKMSTFGLKNDVSDYDENVAKKPTLTTPFEQTSIVTKNICKSSLSSF